MEQSKRLYADSPQRSMSSMKLVDNMILQCTTVAAMIHLRMLNFSLRIRAKGSKGTQLLGLLPVASRPTRSIMEFLPSIFKTQECATCLRRVSSLETKERVNRAGFLKRLLCRPLQTKSNKVNTTTRTIFLRISKRWSNKRKSQGRRSRSPCPSACKPSGPKRARSRLRCLLAHKSAFLLLALLVTTPVLRLLGQISSERWKDRACQPSGWASLLFCRQHTFPRLTWDRCAGRMNDTAGRS